MARPSTYSLIDRLLYGQLADELQRMRTEGLTFDQMAQEFEARGFDISRETIRRWCNDRGIKAPERAAS